MFLVQVMLQHVSGIGYAATCFYYRLCCNMFLVRGMLQHVSGTWHAATCFWYKACCNMFLLQVMLQHVSGTGYAATCFDYSVRCNMFLLQGTLQHVSITVYAATCSYCRACYNMFLLQCMLQHVPITRYAATCFYYRICCNMFRPFCAYVGTDIYTHLLKPSTLKDSNSPRVCISACLTSHTPCTFNTTHKSFCRQFTTEGQSTSWSTVPSSVKSVVGFRRFLNQFMLLIVCTVRFRAH